MVCIAAFIILLILGIGAALISIFNRDFGKKYLALLKKSFHCFGKRVRLQKCDTNFSDDVKTTLLKKVIIKKPKLVKPLSITIEIASILLVIITAWSLIEAVKAGLALWTLGTCNVSQPSNCALGAESCSIDENNLNWFTEWGEIFSNIPDRLKTWNADDYLGEDGFYVAFAAGAGTTDGSVDQASSGSEASADTAISIIDPGCSVCLQSYKNLLASPNFLTKHTLYVIVYPIKNPNGSYRFANSEIITRYLLATDQKTASKIMQRIFTEYNSDGVIYQSVFNNELNHDQAEQLLQDWLKEWGYDATQLENAKTEAYSETVEAEMRRNEQIITEQIKPKGIPTMVYDGKKHLGLFKD